MRCPHCATQHAARPVCRVCGMRADVPAEQPQLVGIETTQLPPVEVHSDPLVGLETTEEVLGDTSIPDAAPSSSSRCRRCGAEGGRGRFCQHCGMALPRPVAAESVSEDVPLLVCLACGVPNPQGQGVCRACGQRMSG